MCFCDLMQVELLYVNVLIVFVNFKKYLMNDVVIE